jgi:hypothetical protein
MKLLPYHAKYVTFQNFIIFKCGFILFLYRNHQNVKEVQQRENVPNWQPNM